MVSNCLGHRARGIFCPVSGQPAIHSHLCPCCLICWDAMTAAFVELPDGASPRVYRTPAGLKNLQQLPIQQDAELDNRWQPARVRLNRLLW